MRIVLSYNVLDKSALKLVHETHTTPYRRDLLTVELFSVFTFVCVVCEQICKQQPAITSPRYALFTNYTPSPLQEDICCFDLRLWQLKFPSHYWNVWAKNLHASCLLNMRATPYLS